MLKATTITWPPYVWTQGGHHMYGHRVDNKNRYRVFQNYGEKFKINRVYIDNVKVRS